MKNQFTRIAEVVTTDEKAAVRELFEGIYQEEMGGVIFFCSADYDLDKLACEMNETFSCPVIGCTTAGEIGTRYINGGMVAVSLSSKVFRLHPYMITPLKGFDIASAQEITDTLSSELTLSATLDPNKMFGLLLIDGLSVLEEMITATLHNVLKGVSLIGASAGDSLNFTETRVYFKGEFISDAAVFSLIETSLDFETFKIQHFVPSEKDMVITEADPSQRIVYEIDGGPAGEEFAKIIGLDVKELTSQIFAMYPVMLQIGEDWYVRSIQKTNDDGSLTFFCAIDEGLPLIVAKGVGIVDTLKEKVKELETDFSEIELTIGFDCILRRLEIMEKTLSKNVEDELRKIKFIGFSTFGEQFNSLHVNQTLTGVTIGYHSSKV
ncbi:MAG: FIST C-terminal domain-containing protein [Candidatus Aegiribacteria sp.]|nr:FIST C-terminal domain-containing protein [Candidatus Aegiribacteria sp.]